MLRAAGLIVAFVLVGCDNDFETIGSKIIGEPGFYGELYDDAIISVQNNDLAPVQTNILPVNLLGVYTDPFYGMQTASVVTQLDLSIVNPNFGNDPVLDSVVLSIPYFHKELEAEEGDSEVKYELDSIYGNSPVKLSIIQSNYFLGDFDPDSDFEERQKYFSNMEPEIEANLGTVLYEDESFLPSAETYQIYGTNSKGEEDTLTLTPRLRVKLPVEFFTETILDKEGSAVLSSKNNFRNYLRGLYIKTEAINGKGNMAMLNFRQEEAGITLYYTSQVKDSGDKDEDGDEEEMVGDSNSLKLNFGPQIVNTFDQEVPEFDNAENIYLKGGEGSMAIIDIFSGDDSNEDGISDELERLREEKWLINEANLIFYVNRELQSSSNEPEHIYLYDLENERMLTDYILDDQGKQNAVTSRTNANHLQPLKRDENGNGIYYKIRITEHIQNLINNGSANVRLGLVVTQNFNLIGNSAVLNSDVPELESVPIGSVISPEGTILFGPDAADEEKRLKLRIYYSEVKD